jgi:hypothetical protein
MARCVLTALLPILLSLSLLADAHSNLLPLRNQEINEADDSLIPQDPSELIPLLRLPSEKENEMITEVPQLVRRPWDGDQLPKVTDDRFSVAPRLREKESDSISRPTEREGESISFLRETERERYSIFLRGGRKGWRFGHPGIGRHHHHGGEMRFGHRRGYGNHFRFRPQFPRSSSFPSYGDHGKEAVSSSFRSFSEESSLPGAEKEELKKRVSERIGEGFPEREHSYGQWKWEFQNGEEHKDGRHEDEAAPWMDWLRSLFVRR